MRHALSAAALTFSLVAFAVAVAATGCGPDSRVGACMGPDCLTGTCDPGQKRECYSGLEETIGVGPCQIGEQTCTEGGLWGNCVGEVAPVGEVCGDFDPWYAWEALR